MRASVVASVDAAPILEPAEHVLDLVPTSVKHCIVWDLDFTVGFRWDAGLDFPLGQGGAKPVCVVAFVTEQGFGFGKSVDHQRRSFEITHLSVAEQHDQRPAMAIANRVQL